MKPSKRMIGVTIAIGLSGALSALPASASCAFAEVENATVAAWMQQRAIAGGALQHRAVAALHVTTARAGDDASELSIVGLDAGYTTWHGDGTELLHSSRPPKHGDFCMGVDQHVGWASDARHHVTLSWDPTGSVFAGPGSIHEWVTLEHTGNAYSGLFTIDHYQEDGTTVLAQPIAGTAQARGAIRSACSGCRSR